jgi:hypothetical protein
MNIHCNAGVLTTNLIADLPGFGEVWYAPEGIANILSLSKVKEKYRLTYDSNGSNGINTFVVHKEKGENRHFRESSTELFYWDTSDCTSHLLINTVKDKKSKYTNRAHQGAVTARKLQNTIGRPSTRTYLDIVSKNLFPNCPVTRADIVAAEDIFGPNLGSLKGKTVRKTTEHVQPKYQDIPWAIMDIHRDVTVAADIMFVNRIGFFMSISRNIKFGTAEMIQNRKTKSLLTSVKGVESIYAKRGFRLHTLLMDNEFEHLRGDLAMMKIHLNVVSIGEHVSEIERYNRTTKERTRSVYNTLSPLRQCHHASSLKWCITAYSGSTCFRTMTASLIPSVPGALSLASKLTT